MKSVRAFLSPAFYVLILAITVGALAFRVKDVGNRPMHGDEAVHAEKFRDLWEHGVYKYDSNEYHGPTIYYAALPSVKLLGRHGWLETREADYRLPIAVIGAAMIPLLLIFSRSLGKKATLAAALFLAISPAFVFYSRYFIQEVPLTFATLGMIACLWRSLQSGEKSIQWQVAAGVFAGLMIASKETAVFTFVCMVISAVAAVLWTRLMDRTWLDVKGRISGKHIALFTVVAIVVASLFVSGFLHNMHAPLDYLKAYMPWFQRAHATQLHKQPFFYYLGILVWHQKEGGSVWHELLIVSLAAAGAIAALVKRNRPMEDEAITLNGPWASLVLWRFLAFFTLSLTLLYSAIPYKTPWCLLSFLLGMILLAGYAFAIIMDAVKQVPAQAVVTVLLLAGAQNLAHRAYTASWTANADPHNPYVYAATASDITKLVERIDKVAKVWPEHNQMVIKVFTEGNYYWPLPWYLRQYPNVGYYNHVPTSKAEAEAAVTLCTTNMDEPMTALLTDDIMNGMNEVRNQVFYEAFIRMDVWTAYVNQLNGGQQRKFVPPPEEK